MRQGRFANRPYFARFVLAVDFPGNALVLTGTAFAGFEAAVFLGFNATAFAGLDAEALTFPGGAFFVSLAALPSALPGAEDFRVFSDRVPAGGTLISGIGSWTSFYNPASSNCARRINSGSPAKDSVVRTSLAT